MRLSSIVAPRDREFFDLFEEASGSILRAPDLLISRHRKRGGHVDRHARHGPEGGGGLRGDLNFVGAFLSLAVAATIAKGIVDADLIDNQVVFGGLIGAISWNLITWYFGLPSSSSHALIGGVVGSAFVAKGPDAVLGDGLLGKVVIPLLGAARTGDLRRDGRVAAAAPMSC